jgi:hypothetical protein
MMNALLVLCLLCQDGTLSVSGKAKREDKEYELTIMGKGRSLQDQETVTLRFRRLANRLHWSDGVLVTEASGDEIRRMAQVEHQAFVHAEHFPSAGEVEVQIGVGSPDSGAPEVPAAHRVFRVASLMEEAHAIANDAGVFDGALRGVRMLLDDLDALRKDPAPPVQRQARLQKRVDWRKDAYRQETAHSFLTASSKALALWLDDVEQAFDLEHTGKETSGMLSSLSGKLFSWEEARNQLAAIEAASLRERALLIVQEIEALGREIGAAVTAGDVRAWAHQDKELTKALELLREADGKFRNGPDAGHYGALVDLNSSTLDDLIVEAVCYLQAAASRIHCAPTSTTDFEDLGRSLMDRSAAFEVRIRTQP